MKQTRTRREESRPGSTPVNGNRRSGAMKVRTNQWIVLGAMLAVIAGCKVGETIKDTVQELVQTGKVIGKVIKNAEVSFGRSPGLVALDDDGNGREPVGGAVVRIHGDGVEKRVTTAADGTFVAELPPGRYRAIAERVRSDGTKFTAQQTFSVTTGTDTELAEPLYIQEAGAIFGVARLDDDTIEDHSGITVVLSDTGIAGITNDRGSFVFPAVPAGTYTIEYWKVGYEPVTSAEVEVEAGQTARVPDVLLAADEVALVGRGTVAGQVLDVSGQPVAGALVTVKGAAIPAVSNSKGEFELSLPPNPYVLIAIADGYDAGQVDVDVVADQSQAVTIVLPDSTFSGVARVDGVVIDGVTGEPLDSTLVVADPPRNQTFTGSDGSFAMNLPNGCYALNVATGGYDVSTINICLEPGDEIDLGDIALYAEGRLSGRCVATHERCDGEDNDCDGEVDEGGVCTSSPPTVPVFSAIQNGDFSNGLDDWNVKIYPGCAGTRTAEVVATDTEQPIVEQHKSVGAGGCGGGSGVTQAVNIDVSSVTTVTLSARVRPISATVGANCGWRGWEYPVFIYLDYLPRGSNNRKQIRWLFYYTDSGTCGKPANSVHVKGIPVKVAQDAWSDFDSGNILDIVSGIGRIVGVGVGGNGWDYQGRVDDIVLTVR
ncbi:MAG: hypothetical protein D6800_13720 [Candidatus Zixiibacteriota bacterium]|nr:MAG: hypothetical protein D6800_13720 [candidate division Zixibacteria bacterium]